MESEGLPLKGLRVLNLTHVFAGPRAAKILGDMGAEVIKIEPPPGAPGRASPRGDTIRARPGSFRQLTRNQWGITLDLASPRGAAAFKALVQVSDVVMENFSLGVMEKLGLGYAELKKIKPDLIMLSMPGLGATGPHRHYVLFGIVQEAICSMQSFTGYRGGIPLKSGIQHCDPINALHAASAVVTAVYHRHKTGEGQFIDFSHLESLLPLIGEALLDYEMNQRVWEPMGNEHPSMAPHGCYRCQGEDAWVVIACATDEEWEKLCAVIGAPELAGDKRFADTLSRWQNRGDLDRIIEQWTLQRDHYSAMMTLQEAGVPAGAVLTTPELLRDAHLKARGYLETLSVPGGETQLLLGRPWKLSRTPGRVWRPAPELGEHNDYIFGELLGLTEESRPDLAISSAAS